MEKLLSNLENAINDPATYNRVGTAEGKAVRATLNVLIVALGGDDQDTDKARARAAKAAEKHAPKPAK